MLKLNATTWSTIEIPADQVRLNPEELSELSWVKAGVATIQWSSLGARLSIGPYAGRLVVPDQLVVDVHELVPGTVTALFELARSSVKLEYEPGPASAGRIPPWLPLLTKFARELSSYVANGIDRRYLHRRRDTPLPRGRIDVNRTLVRHRAFGRQHVIACAIRELSEDHALNRLLLLAADRAERILRQSPDQLDLRRLRVALEAMSGVMHDPAVSLVTAREIAEQSLRPELAPLIDLAELIVVGVSAAGEDQVGDQPVSVWVNVESVFEQAVLHAFAQVRPPGTVRHGQEDNTPLLTGGENLGAEPDVVIETPAETWVVDAKYRRQGAAVTRDELYQLISHSDAYRSERAALVVPRISARDRDRQLGTDSRGCTYEVIVVDADHVDRFRDRLAEWLRLGGPASTQPELQSEDQPMNPLPV